MASYIDINGATQQVTLDASIYRRASEGGVSVEALINREHQTNPDGPTAFRQLCASEGIILGANREFGIRPATMDTILNAGTNVADAVPASRILFPAVILSAMENKLVPDRTMTVNAFDGMVAVDDTINSDRYERPILDCKRAEAARSQPVAQLSEPTTMMTITASDQSRRLTGTSIGLEIADQALKVASLDFLTMSMNRQAEVELAERVDGYILGFLNGDEDWGMISLASAGKVKMASALDPDLVGTPGKLSQTAWMAFLVNNSKLRRIDYIITDIKGAQAIEQRIGRPTVRGDNATSPRIDTLEVMANPLWDAQVKVFITTHPNWPAGTLMGIDSRYAIHRVTSTSLAYQAAEAYALRRSTKFRVDVGQMAYRLIDDAWDVLVLA